MAPRARLTLVWRQRKNIPFCKTTRIIGQSEICWLVGWSIHRSQHGTKRLKRRRGRWRKSSRGPVAISAWVNSQLYPSNSTMIKYPGFTKIPPKDTTNKFLQYNDQVSYLGFTKIPPIRLEIRKWAEGALNKLDFQLGMICQRFPGHHASVLALAFIDTQSLSSTLSLCYQSFMFWSSQNMVISEISAVGHTGLTHQHRIHCSKWSSVVD